jgi:hypothetical protein
MLGYGINYCPSDVGCHEETKCQGLKFAFIIYHFNPLPNFKVFYNIDLEI